MVRGGDISDDRDSLLNMDPPRHTRIRRIVSGAFTPRRVAAWRPRVTEIAERLVAEMVTADSPATYGLLRLASEDVELPSGIVKRGETVLLLLAAANRDPAVYPDPGTFDPPRSPGGCLA